MRSIQLIFLLILPLLAGSTVFEAEKANVLYKAAIENEHAGFTGTGYVNFDNESGGFIIWNVNMLVDSVQKISFVFANDGSDMRPMQLMINDSVVNDTVNFKVTGAWTNWDSVIINAHLKKGINAIKLTGINSQGGPNLDKMIITGLVGSNLYQLVLTAVGGTVEAEPDLQYYMQDSTVKITAVPDQGYIFKNWLGDLSGNENPAVLTMDGDKNITALFEFTVDTTIIPITDKPVGFASLDGGTIGGAGGDTIAISDPLTLANIMADRENSITTPVFLTVSGTITGYDDMIDFKRTGNISLIGVSDSARFLGFGIKMIESNNIVIRNITFADCKVEEKDGLTVDRSHNIWIDHCSFTDSPSSDPNGNYHDGLLDVKKGSYNVTISYNHFSNHRKTALLGHSIKETGDSLIKVTYYANWFDGTYSRHPRTRYGRVHLLNNLYTNIGGYGVGVTCAAQVLLEGNYFENTASPVLISQVNDFNTLSGDPQGFLKAVSNYSIASGEIVENLSGFNFDPKDFYSYDVVDSYLVKSMVISSAGAGKMDILTSTGKQKILFPENIILSQNYPNPFNSSTKISYYLPYSTKVIIRIYDITGRIIKTLENRYQTKGDHTVLFDATFLSSGVYFYRLSTSTGFLQNRKMILLK